MDAKTQKAAVTWGQAMLRATMADTDDLLELSERAKVGPADEYEFQQYTITEADARKTIRAAVAQGFERLVEDVAFENEADAKLVRSLVQSLDLKTIAEALEPQAPAMLKALQRAQRTMS